MRTNRVLRNIKDCTTSFGGFERYEAVGSQEKTALQADFRRECVITFRRECVITSKFSIVQFLVTVDINCTQVTAEGNGRTEGPITMNGIDI